MFFPFGSTAIRTSSPTLSSGLFTVTIPCSVSIFLSPNCLFTTSCCSASCCSTSCCSTSFVSLHLVSFPLALTFLLVHSLHLFLIWLNLFLSLTLQGKNKHTCMHSQLIRKTLRFSSTSSNSYFIAL